MGLPSRKPILKWAYYPGKPILKWAYYPGKPILKWAYYPGKPILKWAFYPEMLLPHGHAQGYLGLSNQNPDLGILKFPKWAL
jgi:hypothetical protein